jgi:hypothetical protein
MERLLRHVSAVDFFKLYKEELNLSALVLRRDSKSRELEGLKILEPEIAGSLPEQMQIDVDLGKVLQFSVNMQSGQKGGFFLDQRRNVAWLRDFLKNVKFSGIVKVLDSFWSLRKVTLLSTLSPGLACNSVFTGETVSAWVGFGLAKINKRQTSVSHRILLFIFITVLIITLDKKILSIFN